MRSRGEWGQSRDRCAEKARANEEATQERLNEQKLADATRSARELQLRFDLDSQVLAQFNGAPLDPGSIQSILVLVQRAYARRPAGISSGDLEMALGRVHFLQVASDEFQTVGKDVRASWVEQARTHLHAAAKAYAEDGATTLIREESISPDGESTLDLRLRLAAGSFDRKLYVRAAIPWFVAEESAVDYRGDVSIARQDAEFLLKSLNELVAALGE